MTAIALLPFWVAGAGFETIRVTQPSDFGEGGVLQPEKVYHVMRSVTIDRRLDGSPYVSGLTFSNSNAKTILYIEKGCRLTVFGRAAQGRNPGGAGIRVTIDSNLIICGEGTLEAHGGDASDGSDGANGDQGIYIDEDDWQDDDDEPNYGSFTWEWRLDEKGSLPYGGNADRCADLNSLVRRFYRKYDRECLPDPQNWEVNNLIGYDVVVGGAGGRGGDGGGGAGAAIGGIGGYGGAGGYIVPYGDRPAYFFNCDFYYYPKTSLSLDGLKYSYGTPPRWADVSDAYAHGVDGNHEISILDRTRGGARDGQGKAGDYGERCGTVTVYRGVELVLSGGNAGTRGGRGGDVGADERDDGSGNTCDYLASGGGGGGGGGAGGGTDGIGCGGTGGGGGGQGGGGGTMCFQAIKGDGNMLPAHGYGGLGGNSPAGKSGGSGTDVPPHVSDADDQSLVTLDVEIHGGLGGDGGGYETAREKGHGRAEGKTPGDLANASRKLIFVCTNDPGRVIRKEVTVYVGCSIQTCLKGQNIGQFFEREIAGHLFEGAYPLGYGPGSLPREDGELFWVVRNGSTDVSVKGRSPNGLYPCIDGDTTLYVTMRARPEKFAKFPPSRWFVYDGNEHTGVVSDVSYSILTPAVGTDAGTYVTRVRMNPGYSIWSDFETAGTDYATATMSERDVVWRILPQSLPPVDDLEESRFSVSAVYDGLPHGLDTNAVETAYRASSEYVGPEMAFDYAASTNSASVAWTSEPQPRTEAGTSTFYYRVRAPGYADIIRAYTVTVEPRSVTIESASGSWPYDGGTHSTNGWGIAEGSFVGGDGVTCEGFTQVAEKGVYANEFTVRPAGATDLGNYALILKPGVLMICNEDGTSPVWATSDCGAEAYRGPLPAGVTKAGDVLWFWRRAANGGASMDFGELPGQLRQSMTVRFVDGLILVDGFDFPPRSGMRFVGSGGARLKMLNASRSMFDLKPPSVPAFLALDASESVDVSWQWLTLEGPDDAASADPVRFNGGAICAPGSAFEVVGCTFRGFRAGEFGGAIFAPQLPGDSSIENCVFEENSVNPDNGCGGAIYASATAMWSTTLRIANCSFQANEAVSGGAIATTRYYSGLEMPLALGISSSQFFGNFASWQGGAIVAEGGIEIENPGKYDETLFGGNVAGGDGGAIAISAVEAAGSAADVVIGRGTTFAGNVASNTVDWCSGGAIAIFPTACALRATGVLFEANEAVSTDSGENGGAFGGAVSCEGADASFGACVFADNVVRSAAAYGGALELYGANASIRNSTFRGSNVEAVDADGSGSERITLDNCVVVGNSTESNRGADMVFTDGVEVHLAHTAYGALSGVFAEDALNISDCTVAEVYDGGSTLLRADVFNPVAALGREQPGAIDFMGREYGGDGSWSMGAYQTPFIPLVVKLRGDRVYDGTTGSNDCAWTWSLTDTNGTDVISGGTAAAWINRIGDVSSAFGIVDWSYGSRDAGDYDSADDDPAKRIYAVLTGHEELWPALKFAYVGTISARPVKFRSASATKPYDGTPLTTSEVLDVSSELGVTPCGVAPGDAVRFNITGSRTQQGESANTFEVIWGADVAAGNYLVTTDDGTLTVTRMSVGEGVIDVEPKGFSIVYGGTNVCPAVTVTYNRPGETPIVLTSPDDYLVSYADNLNATIDEQAKIIVNGRGNYTGWTTNTFTILRRPVLLKSDSATKVFDGTPLTAAGCTFEPQNGDRGLLDAEVGRFRFFTTGRRTDVGSAPNAISSVCESGDANNYAFSYEEGVLTVTERSIESGEFDVQPVDYSAVYCGAEIRPTVTVTWTPAGGGEPVVLVENTDFAVRYEDNVNASDQAKIIVTGRGNFAGEVTRQFSITKRPVTFTSASDAKVYDGTALTNHTVTFTHQSGDAGVLDAEANALSFEVTGSQLPIGESPNTFRVIWGAGILESNYEASKVEGTLTVRPNVGRALEIVLAAQSAVYNGQPQTPAFEVYPLEDGVRGSRLSASDYAAVFADNIHATDAARVTVTGQGTYADYGMAEAFFSITPRTVTFRSPSAEKRYDGTDLRTAAGAMTYTTESGDVGILGTEAGFLSFRMTGVQREVGSSANTFDVIWGAGILESDYAVTKAEGTLTVSANSIDEADFTASVEPSVVYCGAPAEPRVTVVRTPAGGAAFTLVAGTDYTVEYAGNLNVTNAAKAVVTGCGSYTGTVTLYFEITPRAVTFTSASDTKPYDGRPLTAPGVTYDRQAGDAGILDAEAPFLELTGTGSRTEVGTSDNPIAAVWREGILERNYSVTYVPGTLTVTDVPITDGGEFEVLPQDFEIYYGGTNACPAPTVVRHEAGYPDETLVPGRDYVVRWENNFDATDAAKIIVVGNGNFRGAVTNFFRILRRDANFVSPTAQKPYDGTPLVRTDVAVSGQDGDAGILASERPFVSCVVSGEQTEVGSSPNAFEIDWGSINPANYNVTKTEGTLTVLPGDIRGGGFDVQPVDFSVAYGGTNVEPRVTVTWTPADGGEPVVLAEGRDYEVRYANNVHASDAAEFTVTGVGNYSGEVTRLFTIRRRWVQFVSGSAAKVYDGTPLRNETVTYTTESGDVGILDAEAAALSFSVSGEQTEIGSSDNTFEIGWGAGIRESDYDAGKVAGRLTVRANDDPNGVFAVAPTSYSVVYGGTNAEPAVTVTYTPNGGSPVTLVAGVDYTVAYADNLNATNAAKIIVTGLGTYAGRCVTNAFTILPRLVEFRTGSAAKVYDGTALTNAEATYTVQSGDAGILDAEAAYLRLEAIGSQTEPGTSDNTLSETWDWPGIRLSNYQVTRNKGVLTVSPRSISDSAFEVAAIPPLVYGGTNACPAVTVTCVLADGVPRTLVPGTDYTVEYANNLNVTDAATATVTGRGRYTGTVVVQFSITPRAVTFTTPSASKPYDGTPLTAPAATYTPESGDAGILDAEAAYLHLEATGSRTDPGTCANALSEAWNAGILASNYAVTREIGTLTVEAAEIDDPETFTVTLTGRSTFTYAAQFYTPAVEVVRRSASGDLTLVPGTDYRVDYYENYYATNAAMAVVTGIRGYTGAVTNFFSITPRPVGFETRDRSKPYDGQPLTDNAFASVTGGGVMVADANACIITWTGSQTEIGSSPNSFDISWRTPELARSYNVTKIFGTLTVLPGDIRGGEFDVQPSGLSLVYDGHDRTPPVTVTWTPAGGEPVVLEPGADYEVVYEDNKHATDAAKIIVTGLGNYAGVVTNLFSITKRPVTFTSLGATKVWDGTPLVNHTVVYTPESGDVGILNAETNFLSFVEGSFGSQTDVGWSENNFEIVWGEDSEHRPLIRESDYAVTVVKGRLTVLARDPDADGVLAVEPQGYSAVYCGHAITPAVAARYVPNAGEPVELRNGVDFTVAYLDNTNATTEAKFVVSGRGTAYEGLVVTNFFTITPRPVTFATHPGSKVYDMLPLRVPGVDYTRQSGDRGILDDEVPFLELTATGEQTDVGSSANAISAVWNPGILASNYAVTESCGILTVTPAPLLGGELAVEPSDYAAYYCGQPIEPAIEVTYRPADRTPIRLRAGLEYRVDFADNVHATNAAQIVVTGIGNYFGCVTNLFRILPRAVTFVSGSAEKTWDGVALTNHVVTFTRQSGDDGILADEEQFLSIGVTGSQTAVGSSDNTFSVRWLAGIRQSDYVATLTPGVLTVTERTISDGAEFEVLPTDFTVVYGGTNACPAVTVIRHAADGGEAVALTEGADYLVRYENNLNVTDAARIIVSGRGSFCGTVTNFFSITPRLAVFTSASATKPYDGTPLTSDSVTVTEQSGDIGILASERAALSFDVTGWQTTVGESANTFTPVWGGGILAGNYTVDMRTGTLTVTGRSLADGTVAVEPRNLSVYYGGTNICPAVTVTFTPAGGAPVTLTKDVDYAVEYADNRNAGDAAKIIVTGRGQYADVVTNLFSILPRPVTFVSATDSKVWDGTPLKNHTVSYTRQSGDVGILESEGRYLSFNVTGSQTDVGSSANVYTVVWGDGILAANYDATFRTGTLTVMTNPQDGGVLLVETDDATPVYNGMEICPDVTTVTYVRYVGGIAQPPALLLPGRDYTVAYADNVNATNAAKILVTGAGGYAGLAATNLFTILPRQVTITSATDSKVWDGSALVNHTASYTRQSGDVGILAVEERFLSISVTGSQTDVGSSQNAFSVSWQAGILESNYAVSSVFGLLEVLPRSLSGDVAVEPENFVAYYGGTNICPRVTVRYTPEGGSPIALVEHVHYEVAYANNLNASTEAKFTVTGLAPYSGSVVRNFTILPRAVTFTSATDSKPYDGTPLVNHAVSYTEQAGDVGILDAEGGFLDYVVSGRQTAVGSSQNAFEIVWKPGIREGNYAVTKVLGTLTVTGGIPDVAITGGDSFVYGGTNICPQVSVTYAYPNGTVRSLNRNTEYTVEYVDNVHVTDAAKIIVRGIGDFVGEVTRYFSITPRAVTFRSQDATKEYDGSALVNPSVDYTRQSGDVGILAAEESELSFEVRGSQTEIGSSQNAYTVSWGAGIRETDYAPTYEVGTLTVTPQEVVPGADFTVVTAGMEYVYGGTNICPGVTVMRYQSDGSPVLLVRDYDYYLEYADNLNVSDEAKAIVIGTGAFSGVLTNLFSILPRQANVISASATVYGTASTALTASDVTYTRQSGDVGILDAETNGLPVTVTGRQVGFGRSPNTFTLDEAGNPQFWRNYRINKVEGWLEVLEQLDPNGYFDVNPKNMVFAYRGEEIRPDVTVTYVSTPSGAVTPLVRGVDYEVAYADNLDATNVAKVIVRGEEGSAYEGTVLTNSFVILPRVATFVSASDIKAYDGTPLENHLVSVTPQSGDIGILDSEVGGLHFDVTGSQTLIGSCSNLFTVSWDPGVIKKTNYLVSSIYGSLTVVPRSNASFTVFVDPLEYAWTGGEVWPENITVYAGGGAVLLREGVDYECACSDNVDPTARAQLAVRGIGGYRGLFTTNFWITAYNVEYYTDGAVVPHATDQFGALSGTAVSASYSVPAGYTLDTPHSVTSGTVRREDHPDGRLRLVVRYGRDENGDDIPDEYQKQIVFKVVNGWWNEGRNGADKYVWVTLVGADGVWSADGTATLLASQVPAVGGNPTSGFSASGGWNRNPLAPISMSSFPIFLFAYDRASAPRRGLLAVARNPFAVSDRLRSAIAITDFAVDANGCVAGRADAAVIDNATGQVLAEMPLFGTEVEVLGSESVDGAEWASVGRQVTDGNGEWNAGSTENASGDAPKARFFMLRLSE